MAEVDELSMVAQDYLKLIWTSTEWGGKAITTTELAAKMGTSSPNVSDTLRRLANQGLVDYQPYHPVQLTPVGEELALAMVRRHRLLETFLAEILGYEWQEVHADLVQQFAAAGAGRGEIKLVRHREKSHNCGKGF